MTSYDDVVNAQRALSGVLRATPTVKADWASGMVGRDVYAKPEHTQRTGSYKVRGSYNLISQVEAGIPVVAASAGNHAQGVALAASLTGHRATVFMPASASLPKVAATKSYGADVRLEGETVDDAIALAHAYATETGAVWVPPFDDVRIIAGQGTVGLELLVEAPLASTLVVPVGGGGLISGIAVAVKSARPDIRVIGVEAAGAPALHAAMQAGEVVRLDSLTTMADGIAMRQVSALTLAHAQKFVDDMVLVTEQELASAMLLCLERHKAMVEPAGVAGMAAILAGKIPGDGPVATILSGGNVDPLLLGRLIERGLEAAGRYTVVRVVLTDRPGQLAALSRTLGELSLNVIEVDHNRRAQDLAISDVDIRITVITQGQAHKESVVPSLIAAGFRAELLD